MAMQDALPTSSVITDVISIFNNSVVDNFPSTNVTSKPYWKEKLEKWVTIIITFNLIFLMVGMGSATYLKEVWLNLKKPWGSVIGMICQFGILPGIGVGTATYLNLPPYQAVGVLILCCSPGGAFSNFFAYWLNGDIALSLLMTATSSLLAFGGMPLNMWIYASYWIDEEIVVPYVNILISMAFATGPALVGMLIRHYSRVWAQRVTKICSALGWIGAIISAVFMTLINWESILSVSKGLCLTAAILPGAGFLTAFIIAKLCCFSNAISRTIGIEVGCQNVVVALNVILISFREPEIREQMILFPLIYSVAQMAEVVSFILAYRCYKYVRRLDETKEMLKSEIDTTVLMRVPTPFQDKTPRHRRDGAHSMDPDVIHNERYNTETSVRGPKVRQLSGLGEANVYFRSEDRYSRKIKVLPDNGNDIIRGQNFDPARLIYSLHEKRRQGELSFEGPDDSYSSVPFIRNLSNDRSSSPEVFQSEREIFGEEQRFRYHSDSPPLLIQNYSPQGSNKWSVKSADSRIVHQKLNQNDKSNMSPLPRSPSMNSGYGFPTFRKAQLD